MRQWYEIFFENYGRQYDNESFTKGTIGECDFIEKEIRYNKKIKILDIGCGTGRHSIELARRGYQVTGVDLSESMLQQARKKAADQQVDVRFELGDARNLVYESEFDLVIMLCEGSFSLMETDEMNYQILKQAKIALREKGKIIFTTLNGLFPLFHSVNDFMDSQHQGGNSKDTQLSFDLMTFRDKSILEFEDDSGEKKSIECNERYYVPSEITWMLHSLGFESVEIFGAKLGAYSRNDQLTTEDFEMLVIAQ